MPSSASLALRDDTVGASSTTAWPLIRMALAAGDERLALDPLTGRNRYGVPPNPAVDEIWFSSSTASPIQPCAYAALDRAVTLRLDGRTASQGEWPQAIRNRLAAVFGVQAAQVVLTGSGTEAEFIVLTLARRLMGDGITSIVIAPDETGSGVLAAAEGRHFLASAAYCPHVPRGERLRGLDAADIVTNSVAIREACGALRPSEEVDAEVMRLTDRARATARTVIVHCLDVSKTGAPGLSRTATAALQEAHGDGVLVTVDTCQLRCDLGQVGRDLAAGRVVMLTGSKFIGGPPFAGAVLLPTTFLARLERLNRIAAPGGLGAYSALSDWPEALRGRLGQSLPGGPMLAPYFRWEAALHELERYARVPDSLAQTISGAFRSGVEDRLGATPTLRALPAAVGAAGMAQTIVPFVPTGGRWNARGVYEALNAQGVHLGQPVTVGPSEALRVCLSAPQISDVAERLGASGLEAATAPLMHDLNIAFAALAQAIAA